MRPGPPCAIFISYFRNKKRGISHEHQEISARLAGLAVFRGLLDDPVLADYSALIGALARGAGRQAVCEAAGRFEAALFAADTDDLSGYIAAAVLEARTSAPARRPRALSPALEQALDSELQFLEALSAMTLDGLLEAAGCDAGGFAFLPRWTAHPTGLANAYKARLSEMGQRGYGMFARHHVFMLKRGGQADPCSPPPTPQRLADLPGYEREREKIIANTKALLRACRPTTCCCTGTPAPANPAR